MDIPMNSKVKKESLKNSFLQLPDVLGNIADLAPGNNFDKSWMEGLNQFEIDKVFTIIPPEGDIEDDGRVTYKFNSDGFRCDDLYFNYNKVSKKGNKESREVIIMNYWKYFYKNKYWLKERW